MHIDTINLINELLGDALQAFIWDNCQVAAHEVLELFTDEATIVLLSVEVLGDDSHTYMLYLELDLEDESSELLSKRDFDSVTPSLPDLTTSIPELS